jgi:hypothetical protein
MRQYRRPSTFAGGSNGKRFALRVGDRVYSLRQLDALCDANGTVTALPKSSHTTVTVLWDSGAESVEYSADLALCSL